MTFDANQVYQPAEDTFLLIDAALSEVREDDLVCEIGCGSGEVSVSLLGKCAKLVAVDINPHAVACTKERGVSVFQGDMFSPFVHGELFDLILFNAPYLPTLPEERVGDFLDYALDGGESGRVPIEKFLPEAVMHLSKEGRILLLISSLTGIEEVSGLCSGFGLAPRVVACETEEDGERLVVLKIVRSQ